MNQLKS